MKSTAITGKTAIVLLFFSVYALIGNGAEQQIISVQSPNKLAVFKIWIEDSEPRFSIQYKDAPVIEPSPVVMEVDKSIITKNIKFVKTNVYSANETYPWRGVHSVATNNFNGLALVVLNTRENLEYTFDVRVFNDGAAFRFIVPGNGNRVPDEATVFKIPQSSVIWYHGLGGHYEDVYAKKKIEEIKVGEWLAPSVTIALARENLYAAITEAALFNYSGMALQSDGKRGLTLVLGHKHPISYPFRLRYSNDIERVSQPALINGEIKTPWRVVMFGDLNGLVNCDIVHNLCPPPDPLLFPDGVKTTWIKPGRAVWRYLDGGPQTLEAMKDFSRWAGELGFEYHVIEGFWSRWSDEQIKELVDYSKKCGVGLWFWRHSKQLRTDKERAEFFKKLSDLGVVGAKIDFFDHEHKDVVDLYAILLKEAAKYKIMVNFHGANKPTGESRTYPNELVREAIRGMEASRLKERAAHDATLPFTRFLAGHADYTPVHFGARRGDTTWVHQIATAVVFTAPLLTYAAHPTNLLANPAVDIIKSIPPIWDETVVLPVSKIGETAAFARKNGNRWFIGIVNGAERQNFVIKPEFLDIQKYNATVVKDDLNNPASVIVEKAFLTRESKIEINLAAGGGFLMRLEPTK
ncbi:MAG: glycoside hydrolase family 97 protein [Verrucomicrobiae bacterium]|nr:glycoside hydrolase family 97 protein [Verrucomicrobiae bacterium]